MSSSLFAAAASGGTVLVSESGVEHLQLVGRSGTSTFLLGGTSAEGEMPSGPGPYDLLSAALAACTVMTVRLYAERKHFPLHRVQVGVSHHRGESGFRGTFERMINLEGPLLKEHTERLLAVANLCPVAKTLSTGAEVHTSLGSAPPARSDNPENTNYVQDAERVISEMEMWGPDA